MRKCILIARSNIRKAKGQAAAMIVLIMLSAVMLNLWLMLAMDYKANFDRYHKAYNAEHVTLSVDGDSKKMRDFLSQTIDSRHGAAQYCLDDCMHMTGSFPYNGGQMNAWLVFIEKQAALKRPIGKIEIIKESNLTSGVYLPMIYRSDDIDVGKTVQISIGSRKMTYTVCGFFNSVMMGSHNCVMTQIVLTKDQYAKLEDCGYAPKATLCSIRLNDPSQNLSYEASLKSEVSNKYPNITMVSNCYAVVSQSRYISQMIASGIMAAMAFFVLLIALVVIVSNIINYIQVNMKNLGALKAAGYTSGQIIQSLLLQFFIMTFFASAIGIALSYGLFPAVNTMMIAQTGIPYTVRFLIVPFIGTIAILSGTVAFFAWLASYRIKKIEPIVALRCGIQTHNFKRNHIPLARTKAPLQAALALKTTFSGRKYNITVCITMLVLSLVVVFSGLMMENVITDITPFLQLIAGETADSCVNVQEDAEEEFLADMQADRRVEKVYLYTSLNVSHTGGAELMAMICDDFAKVNNQSIVFEGRFPKYENETAIAAKYAQENGLEIGEEISISANGKKERYLICGFTQVSNNLGRDCLFTRAGYERLGSLTNTSYYMNLTSNTDIDAFHQEIKEDLGGAINTTINVQKTVDGTGSVYVKLMTIIVIAVLVLSVIIIVFVLYLLVRTMLNNKMHDYGIMKALGFTTKQLILQTALSFMPATVLSAAAGLVVCSIIINPLTALFLNGIGIVKCTFTVPVGLIAAAGAALVLGAFAAVCLLSLKIRKIAPRELLMGE